MKRIILLLAVFAFMSFATTGFKKAQLQYPRVRQAFAEKEIDIMKMLKEHEIDVNAMQLAIFAYKEEQEIEVWAKDQGPYKLLKTYKFCSNSGVLGPKRKQGDLQIPEGLYYIAYFNPASNFYLSLGINYPNESDKKRAHGNAGGDIFIHGNCVTIGCIPITDDKIKELYAICVLAKDAGAQKINAHFFPFRMTNENMKKHENNQHFGFWKELQPFYSFFESKREIPAFSIDKNGVYKLQ